MIQTGVWPQILLLISCISTKDFKKKKRRVQSDISSQNHPQFVGLCHKRYASIGGDLTLTIRQARGGKNDSEFEGWKSGSKVGDL